LGSGGRRQESGSDLNDNLHEFRGTNASRGNEISKSHWAGRRLAFTLIEILVVIAVVSILLAILIPAASSSRRIGRRVACLSNIRQLGLANLMYASDYDRLAPFSQFAGEVANLSGGVGVNVRWCWSDDTPGDPRQAFRNGLLYRYLGDTIDVAGCAEFETPANVVDFYAQFNLAYPVAVDYGYNGLLLGERHENFHASDSTVFGYRAWVGYQPGEIGQPDTTTMFADAGQLIFGQVVANPTLSPPITVNWENGTPRALVAATAHARHTGQTSNVAWVDGHASSTKVQIHNDQPDSEKSNSLGFIAPDLNGERSNAWMFVK